nr:DUF6272 family protein [Pectobacterium colocasium]
MMPNIKYTEFFSPSHQHDITLYYVGYFSQNIISSLAETMRLQLEKQLPAGIRRRLFSTFVEMVQNITRYSAAPLNGARSARRGSAWLRLSGLRKWQILPAMR